MKRILKYPLTFESNIILLPAGSNIVLVAEQGQSICMWAEVPALSGPVDKRREFHLVATGQHVDDEWRYRGTAICESGRYVWHLFEVI